jgi:hypothetical protein
MVSEKIVESVKTVANQVDMLCETVKTTRVYAHVKTVKITTTYNGSTDSAHSAASVTMRIFS